MSRGRAHETIEIIGAPFAAHFSENSFRKKFINDRIRTLFRRWRPTTHRDGSVTFQFDQVTRSARRDVGEHLRRLLRCCGYLRTTQRALRRRAAQAGAFARHARPGCLRILATGQLVAELQHQRPFEPGYVHNYEASVKAPSCICSRGKVAHFHRSGCIAGMSGYRGTSTEEKARAELGIDVRRGARSAGGPHTKRSTP